jgi:hypothetical protein
MRLFCVVLPTVLLSMLVIARSASAPEQLFLTTMGPLDPSEPITFWIADGQGVPGYRATDQDLARTALDAWSRESDGLLGFVEADSEERALIRISWVGGNQGRFGETRRIHVGGRPGALVFIMPDIAALGPALATASEKDPLLRDTIVYLTAIHELGHAVGLPHTDDFVDIMYSFSFGGDIVEYFERYRRLLDDRSDIRFHSGLSETDREILRRVYGVDEDF